MRIDELTGYKTRPERTIVHQLKGLGGSPNETERREILGRFLEDLEAEGYTKIGHGAFGAVFGHPKLNYAIKVFKNDPAYLAFVGYVLKHQGDPHLPKFRGKFMRLNGDYYAVRMELLKPLPGVDHRVAALWYLSEYLPDGVLTTDGVFEFLRANEAHLRSVAGPEARAIELALTDNPSLVETFLGLLQVASAKWLHMDIKLENCMLRGNEMVITDPFWDEDAISPF